MLSFDDIANAVTYENMDISGGQIEMGDEPIPAIERAISNALALEPTHR